MRTTAQIQERITNLVGTRYNSSVNFDWDMVAYMVAYIDGQLDTLKWVLEEA